MTMLALLVALSGQTNPPADELDERVRAFLRNHEWDRRDLNIPAVDGQTMYDIIVEKGYRRALEIGTSTGHSSIWIAWALSRTGGRLITVEVDERRHREALENFRHAGVSDLIDARIGDAHVIVPALEGPFDFVFSDADKGWYLNYLKAVLPKLEVGGCYTSHNVSLGDEGPEWNREYMEWLLKRPNLETTVDTRGRGLAITYKVSD